MSGNRRVPTIVLQLHPTSPFAKWGSRDGLEVKCGSAGRVSRPPFFFDWETRFPERWGGATTVRRFHMAVVAGCPARPWEEGTIFPPPGQSGQFRIRASPPFFIFYPPLSWLFVGASSETILFPGPIVALCLIGLPCRRSPDFAAYAPVSAGLPMPRFGSAVGRHLLAANPYSLLTLYAQWTRGTFWPGNLFSAADAGAQCRSGAN